MLADLDCVAFDFDGTLTAYVQADLSALEQLRQWSCPQVAAPDFADRAVQEIMAFHDRVAAGRSAPPDMDAERLSRTLAAYGVRCTEAHLGVYRAALIGALTPVPGAVHLLSAIKRRGLKLALLSNTYDGPFQRQRLAHSFPDRPFDVVLMAGELGVFKPDPRAFQALAEALRVAPGRGLSVGDLPAYDVPGAVAAGWHAALVSPSARQRDRAAQLGAVLVASDLNELRAHLLA